MLCYNGSEVSENNDVNKENLYRKCLCNECVICNHWHLQRI